MEDQQLEERHHSRGGGLVWPVILIGSGIVFLLNNLGILPWDVWQTIFRLWPILLIAVGLDILIGRRSAWGSLLVVVLLLGALAFALWLGTPQYSSSVTYRSETINQPLDGAKSAEVEIGFGTGDLHIDALAESAGLIEGTVDLGPREQIDRTYSQSGESAIYGLRSEDAWVAPSGNIWDENKNWDLGLSRDIPIRLSVHSGVGRSTLDLSQLNLTMLKLNGGVGQTMVTLPRRGLLSAEVENGVGEVKIFIPKGMAARVQLDSGLGSSSVEGDFIRQGETYTSPNFDSATNRVDMRVHGGIGKIVVQESAGE